MSNEYESMLSYALTSLQDIPMPLDYEAKELYTQVNHLQIYSYPDILDHFNASFDVPAFMLTYLSLFKALKPMPFANACIKP
jgi:hypothetical protein